MNTRLFFNATKRNRNAIGQVLERFLPKQGLVLELASGSGEHGVFFQKLFPNIIWQCSDIEPSHLESIDEWIKHERLDGFMPKAINLNIKDKNWNLNKYNIKDISSIVCINLIHISHWDCTLSLFRQSQNHLEEDSPLIIYGPFKNVSGHTSKSNLIFDQSLRSINKDWGLRDLESVKEIANKFSFKKQFIIEMPANNTSLILKKN